MDLEFERGQLEYRLKAIEEDRENVIKLMAALDLVIGEFVRGPTFAPPAPIVKTRVYRKSGGLVHNQVQEAILARGGKASLQDLTGDTKLSYSSVRMALERLKRKGYVVMEGRGHYRLVKVDRGVV